METMNDKLIHLEFMKAVLTGSFKGTYVNEDHKLLGKMKASLAAATADAALLEYQKRWEGKEESQCRCDKKKLAPMPTGYVPSCWGEPPKNK